MLKAIIFDFDGVILESNGVKSNAFKTLYNQCDSVALASIVEHHRGNYSMSRYEKIQFYHQHYLGIVLSEDQLDIEARKFSDLVKKQLLSVPFVAGAKEFLLDYTRYLEFFVSSGTQTKELIYVMEARNILKEFEYVYGSPEKKDEHIKAILGNTGYICSELLFIGDRVEDMNLAKKYDIPFIGRASSNDGAKFDNTLLVEDLWALRKVIQVEVR